MKLKIETRLHAEQLATRAGWLLIPIAAFLMYGHVANSITIGCTAVVAALTLTRFALSRSVAKYQGSGQVVCSASFLVQAVICAFAAPNTFMWVLAPLTIALQTFVERNPRRTILYGALVSMAEAAVAFPAFRATTLIHSIVLVAVTSGLTVLIMVLAMHSNQGQLLDIASERLGSMLECGSELAASTDLDSTILHTLRSAVQETGASCGYVMLLDDLERQTLVTEAAYGKDGEFEFPERLQVGEGMSGYVAKVGQPIAVSDSSQEHHDFDGITTGVKSAACVPLSIRTYSGGGEAASDQILGVMTLLDTSHTQAFSDEDMELLRSLGALISVAVSSARMEERRRTTFLLTLESLATALEARDEYTRGHSQRVCEVSLMIGEQLGVGPDAMEELRVGTILHDIGKIGVPDAILNKRSRLTDEEFATMKSHPVIGYEICKPLMLSEGVLMIIRNHHEKLDGSGYPDGLKGGELPLSLRIVCVADAFDAMSSRRPYRSVMETSSVLAELSKGAGTQFDPVVVEHLKEIMATERLQDLYRQHWGEQHLKVA